MKELVEVIAKALVEHPEEVKDSGFRLFCKTGADGSDLGNFLEYVENPALFGERGTFGIIAEPYDSKNWYVWRKMSGVDKVVKKNIIQALTKEPHWFGSVKNRTTFNVGSEKLFLQVFTE